MAAERAVLDELDVDMDDRRLFDALPDPVVIFDTGGVLRWGNWAATEQLGWRPTDWVGRSVTDFLHRDDIGLAAESLVSVQTKTVGTAIEVRVRAAWGAHRLMELRGRAITDRQGTPLVVAILRDITERRRWEVSAGNAAMVQTLLECSPVIALLVDVHGCVQASSAALVRQLGQPLEATIGRAFLSLVAPDDRDQVEMALASVDPAATVSVEARLLHVDGSGVAHQLTVVNLADDPVIGGLVVTAHEITELVEARERLHHLAIHDPLTGLLNRAGLLEATTSALSHEHAVGLVFLDLDNFKQVNDRFGHRAGDHVLVEVAARLRGLAGDAPVGRLGGDEFIILFVDDVAAVTAMLADLPEVLAAPIAVAETTVSIRAACGAAVAQPGDDPVSLLAAADTFMYDAKRRQPGRQEPFPN